MASTSPSTNDSFSNIWKTLLAFSLILNLILISFPNSQNVNSLLIRCSSSPASSSQPSISNPISPLPSPTNHSHIAYGIVGSVQTWPVRKGYIETWWRPNKTRGYFYLDKPPTSDLLPWPETVPPYRIVDNISKLLEPMKLKTERELAMPRIVHGILELFREEHDNVRWVVMGDDDSIFFVDNIVDVLAQYDHTKYFYLGWHSESVIANFWHSFNQGFGGGGVVLSYPLARALANDMDGCLTRYKGSADLITMQCINDFGVDLTLHKGMHQVDLRGDISGYLSAHPKVHLMSFHHFHALDPIFPNMNRLQATRHLMKAGDADQSRLLQQTICYHRENQWSFSISWGYSVNIYERVMPRSYLQMPVETFTPWVNGPERPFYMFNTRTQSNNSCEAPHVFFMKSVRKSITSDKIVTTYVRARERGMPACAWGGYHSADGVKEIRVVSPMKKRLQMDRAECCDIVELEDSKAKLKFRECETDENIIAFKVN